MLEALEPRLLLSADAAVALMDSGVPHSAVEERELVVPAGAAMELALADDAADLIGQSLFDSATELIGGGVEGQGVATAEEVQELMTRQSEPEVIELRYLTVVQAGSTVTFRAWIEQDDQNPDTTNEVDEDTDRELYLRTTSNVLEYSTDNVNWSSDASGSTVSTDGATLTLNAQKLKKVHLNETFYTFGGSLTVEAGEISVDTATISTRKVASSSTEAQHQTESSTGNSGNLRLDAPVISVTGSSLLTHVESGSSYTAGELTLNSNDDHSFWATILPFYDERDTDATISLTSSTIKAGNVTMLAHADSVDVFDDDGPLQSYLEPGLEMLASLSLIGGLSKSTADAAITISGGSITGYNVDIEALARSEAKITTLTIYLGVAVGISKANANFALLDRATINATGNVDLTSQAESDVQAFAVHSQFGALSPFNEKVSLTVAWGDTEIDSKANIASGTRIDATGSVNILAGSTKDSWVTADAVAGQGGVLGFGVAVSYADSDVDALVDGTIVAGGDVTIKADLVSEKNDVSGSSSVGQSDASGWLSAKTRLGAAGGVSSFWGMLFGIYGSKPSVGKNKSGFSAGIGIFTHDNEVIARIGDGATVTAGGDVTVTASTLDFPEISASASVTSTRGQENDYLFGLVPVDGDMADTRERTMAIAAGGALLFNTAKAYIADATVTAGDDITVHAAARVPYIIEWHKWKDITTITDKLNNNFGIQNGFFSSWSEATAWADQKAFGGSLNAMNIDGTAKAWIGAGAIVNAGGDLAVVSKVENDTINFVGTGSSFLSGSGMATGGKGVGASLLFSRYQNTVHAEIKSGAIVAANTLMVYANTEARNISLALQGGAGDEFAFQGAFNAVVMNNSTVANIDDGAQVQVGAGTITLAEEVYDLDSMPDNGNLLLTTSIPTFRPFQEYETGKTRVDTANDKIYFAWTTGFITGTPLLYNAYGQGPVGGLTEGQIYYAITNSSDNGVKLATSLANATAGVAIDLNLIGTGEAGHSLYAGVNPLSASAPVTAATDRIYLGFAHGFTDGQELTYDSGGGNAIDGLVHGQKYYVVVVDATTISLAVSESEAKDSDAELINLTLTGTSGNAHFLVPTSSAVSMIDIPLSLDTNKNGKLESGDTHITGYSKDGGTRYYHTNLSLLVLAEDDSVAITISGATVIGSDEGAGASVSANVITRSTTALVGNRNTVLGNGSSAPYEGVDSGDTIYLGYSHGLTTGDVVSYSSGGDFVIGGLVDGARYYVKASSGSSLKVGRTLLEAIQDASTQFGAGDVTDGLSSEVIDLGYTHGFQLGDRILYSNGGGTSVGGLTNNQTYSQASHSKSQKWLD